MCLRGPNNESIVMLLRWIKSLVWNWEIILLWFYRDPTEVSRILHFLLLSLHLLLHVILESLRRFPFSESVSLLFVSLLSGVLSFPVVAEVSLSARWSRSILRRNKWRRGVNTQMTDVSDTCIPVHGGILILLSCYIPFLQRKPTFLSLYRNVFSIINFVLDFCSS